MSLLELRRQIARFIARTGAKRATPEMREGLRSSAREFLAAAKAGVSAADKKFQDLFAASTRNSFAVMAMGPLGSLSRRFFYAHHVVEEAPPVSTRR